MAITNNITTENSQYGIAFNGAYYRIVTAAVSRQRGTDPKFTVMIDLSGYAAVVGENYFKSVKLLENHMCFLKGIQIKITPQPINKTH